MIATRTTSPLALTSNPGCCSHGDRSIVIRRTFRAVAVQQNPVSLDAIEELRLYTNHAMDRFFAQGISSLVSPSARPLQYSTEQAGWWLPDFLLNSLHRMRVVDPTRQLVISMLRRTDAAVRHYADGRVLLDSINATSREPSMLSYSRSLYGFEQCIAMTYQARFLIREIDPSRTRPFEPGDGSEYQRMNEIYNAGKHADGKIATSGAVPEHGTLPVWLLNDGIACSNAILSYDELAAEVDDVCEIAEAFSKLPD